MFEISRTPIDPVALRARLDDPRAGGFVAFEGWVRNHNLGKFVTALEYQAYDALAIKEGDAIIAEAKAKFGIYAGLAVHHAGLLPIGGIAVWVGVSSAHRDAAFDACRYIIDEIKIRVPVWKNEHYTDGSTGWVECLECAAKAAHSPQGHFGCSGNHKH